MWFGVNGSITKASIMKVRKGNFYDVVIRQKGIMTPASICTYSIWNKCVIYLYHSHHYMNIKEYVDLYK